MEARQVRAGAGWTWIVEGFALFRKSPLIWIVLCLILVGIGILLGFIRIIGPLVFYLLSPVFLAGLMLGARALEQGEDLEIAHLWEGFRRNTSALVTIGGVYLVGQVLILGVVLVVGGGPSGGLFHGPDEMPPAGIPGVPGEMMLPLLVGLALSIPLMMAVWFAPLLVIFDNLAPIAAMRLSFSACLKNLLPFLVYGVILLVLAFIAAVPVGLGLLILVPTIFASIYKSYQDIFSAARPDQPSP